MTTTTRTFLISTDHGRVVVTVNPLCQNALDTDLLLLEKATEQNTAELAIETPLRAFSPKIVDIIEAVGTGDLNASPTMLAMMRQEKATQELKRIEKFAKEQAAHTL